MQRLFQLVVMTLLVAACGAPVGETTAPSTTAPAAPTATTAAADPGAAFAQASARWEASGLETYHFVFEDDCGECMPVGPRVVVVRGGVPGDAADPSVDSLFGTIATALDAGSSVEVEYHPRLGHPIDIWIDKEARAYDGGTHWLIRDLEEGVPDLEPLPSDHEAAIGKWADAGYSGYRYDMVTHDIIEASFSEPYMITVRDGQVVDVQFQGAPEDAEEIPEVTVEQMFSLIESETRAGSVVGVLYHDIDGHPVFVSVRPPDNATPPSLAFSVHDLVPLP